MFKNASNLGDEDLELETSFTPIYSSTQESLGDKRRTGVTFDENVKKMKIDKSLNSNSPFRKNPSFENIKNDYAFSPKNVVKRMFPGPAGLLPDSLGKSSELIPHNSTEDVEDFLFCSQRSVSTFVDGPWKMMKDDFSSPSGEQLFEKFTISWIKKKYGYKKIIDNYKAPFLAAVIQNLEIVDGTTPSIHVTLKDTTGSIDAVILYSFYKEYLKYLTTESVIVLKQFSVLSTHEGQCLTITSNNTLVIYHVRDSNNKEDKDDTSDKNEPAKKIVLKEYSVDDIWKEANTVKILQNNTNALNNINYITTNRMGNKLESSPVPKSINSTSFVPSNRRDVVQPTNSNCTNFMLPKFSKIGENVPSSSHRSHSVVSETTNHIKEIAVNDNLKKQFDFKKTYSTEISHSEVNINPQLLENTNENFINNNCKFKTVEIVKTLPEVSSNDNVIVSCSQISVKADKKHSEIWKNVFEDVDADSLFDDF